LYIKVKNLSKVENLFKTKQRKFHFRGNLSEREGSSPWNAFKNEKKWVSKI